MGKGSCCYQRTRYEFYSQTGLNYSPLSGAIDIDKPDLSILTLREILEASRSSALENTASFNNEDPNIQLFEVVREYGVEYLGRARAGDTVWLSRKLEMIVLGDAAFQNVRVLDGCARHAMFVNPALATVNQLGDIRLDAPLNYLFHIPDHEDWEFKFLRYDFPPTDILFFRQTFSSPHVKIDFHRCR